MTTFLYVTIALVWFLSRVKKFWCPLYAPLCILVCSFCLSYFNDILVSLSLKSKGCLEL